MPQSARSSLPPALAAGLCVAGVFAGGVLSACDVTIKDGDIKNVSVQARATQEWSRQYPLAAGGRVEIVNVNGSIEVVAGPAGAVDVAAVLEARAMTRGAREGDTERSQDRGVGRPRSHPRRHGRRVRAGAAAVSKSSYKVTCQPMPVSR